MNKLRWMTPALLSVLALLVLVAAPAWAAEDAHGGGEKPGLLDMEWASAIIAIVVFLVLLALLTKLAWRPILEGLQKREETIRQAVADAQKASEDARAMADEYKKKLDAATDEARAIAEDAKKNAEGIKARIEEDARKNADETVARSKREIERAKQTAIDEILGEVTSIAAEAASRIVKKNLTTEDNAALVDEVVREFTSSRSGGRG
jgi:F-type H+-transporting ATPase subunit b